jgi:curved DNA-binding protein CbpA
MPAGKVVADPYAVLGIDRSASAAEIRAAYRALVARYHPDLHHGNPLEALAGERMAEINQAYELLSDPDRRAAFDRDGAHPARTGAGAAPPRRNAGVPQVAKWGLLILALPLLIRGVVALVRAIAGMEGELFGVLGALRGTPAELVLALLAGALLGWALLRSWRRRRKRRQLRD